MPPFAASKTKLPVLTADSAALTIEPCTLMRVSPSVLITPSGALPREARKAWPLSACEGSVPATVTLIASTASKRTGFFCETRISASVITTSDRSAEASATFCSSVRFSGRMLVGTTTTVGLVSPTAPPAIKVTVRPLTLALLITGSVLVMFLSRPGVMEMPSSRSVQDDFARIPSFSAVLALPT